MKIGFTLYRPDLDESNANRHQAIELATKACEKGADLVLTPEEATYDRKNVETYWNLHWNRKYRQGTRNLQVISTEEQLAPFKELTKKYGNAIGVGFIEFTQDALFNSYALVSGDDVSIRRKAIQAHDWDVYLCDQNNASSYEAALGPNGSTVPIRLKECEYQILSLICREVDQNKGCILQARIPADLIVIPSYGLGEFECNRFMSGLLTRENVLKVGGTVAYCDGKLPFARVFSGYSRVFDAIGSGIHIAEI